MNRMKLKIDISRQGNFLFALLMIHFLFFGFICNVDIYEYNVGLRILYLNRVLFNPLSFSFLSSIILFFIILWLTENIFLNMPLEIVFG